jgi:predicted amidohydrolase
MKIAGVQIDITIAAPAKNVSRMIDSLKETHRAGAELTIFPECAVSGYCFGSLAEALEVAEPVTGPSVRSLESACREFGVWAVVGMIERDGAAAYNAAVLIGPEGLAGVYRKVHLPYLGVDMHTTYGDRPFAVHQAGPIRVGMNICYDAAFPEATRAMALQGADLIALPTNWPPGAEATARHAIPTRALENAVYFAAVNRVGEERGFQFIGMSSICGPNGEVLAASQSADEEILYAEIDPARSRSKRIIRVPDRHEIDRLADRRPEFYGELAQPHALVNPRHLRQGK